jgi:hypothetical protein
MAHYAEINLDNATVRVIAIANQSILDENGQEQDALGVELIDSLGLGGRWIRCSYNGSFRAHYPGRGFTYDEALDAFIPPNPFPSWVLDEATCTWVAPVPKPDGEYVWDEQAGDWVEA